MSFTAHAAEGRTEDEKAVCRICAARSTHGAEPEPEDVAATSEHDGSIYSFCSEECKEEFDLSPDWWAPLELPFPVPALSVSDLGGNPIPLEIGAGKLTVLDFWATWCQPCRKTMPQLQERFEAGDPSLRIIGISIDEGPRARKKVRKAIKDLGITYPIVLDDQQSPAWTALKIYAVPTIVLVDEEGRVIWRFTGPEGDKKLEEFLLESGRSH